MSEKRKSIDELLEEIRNEKKSTTSSNETSRKSIDDLLLEAKAPSALEDLNSRLTQYVNNSSSLANDYTSRYFDEEGNYINQYRDDSEGWLDSVRNRNNSLSSEADAIKNTLEKYKSYISEDSYKEISEMLEANSKALSEIYSHSSTDYDQWSQFGSEDEYKKALAKLEEQEKLRTYDIDSGNKKIEQLKAEMEANKAEREMAANHELFKPEDIDLGEGWMALGGYSTEEDARIGEANKRNQQAYMDYANRISQLEKEIDAEEQYINNAGRVQNAYKLAAVADPESEHYDPDFEYYAQMGESYENPSFVEAQVGGKTNEIQNPVKFTRENFDEYMKESNKTGGSRADSWGILPIYMQMSDDEYKTYNYYLAKDNENSRRGQKSNLAQEYIDSLDLAKRAEGNIVTGVTEYTNEHPWSASAVSVATSLGSGVEYLTDLFEAAVTGEMGSNTMAAATNAIRGTVSDKVNWEIGNWDAFDFLYNTGMSAADSMTSGLMFGNAGGVALGLSAAAQGTNDALERGMSGSQAFWNGLSAGVFEGLFETVSIGNFNALKEGFAINGKGIIKNIAKSMLVNASEETLTEIANLTYDRMINGDFSHYEIAVRRYMEEGMSEAEAKNKVAREQALQVIESGASGALMGFGFGTVGSVANTVGSFKDGQAVLKDGNVGNLVDIAKTFSLDSDAYKLAEKVNENSKALDVGRLYRATMGSMSGQNISDIKAALVNKGISEAQAEKTAKWMANAAMGGKLTNSQLATLMSNDVLAETFNDVVSSDSSVMERGSLYNKLYKIASSKNADSTTPKETQTPEVKDAGQTISEPSAARIANTEGKVSNTGTAINNATGEDVSIKGIASIDAKNKTMMLELEDGTKVNSKDISYESEAQAALYESALEMGYTPQVANSIIQGYTPNSNISVGEYLLGTNEGFNYGWGHVPEKGRTGSNYSLLNKAQMEHAVKVGEEARAADDKAREAKVARNQPQTTNKKGKGKYGARVVVSKGITDRVKASVEALDAVAKALKINITVDDLGGNAYGYYKASTNELIIDANAGGNHTLLFTASHELVHYIRNWSPSKFTVLADFLMEQYAAKGEDVDALIQAEINKAYKATRGKHQMTYNEAYEEVVAQAMQGFLTDSNFIERLAALQKKDASLAKRLVSKLKEILNNIRTAYQGMETRDRASQAVKEMGEAIDELYAKMEEGLIAASEASQTIGSRNLEDFSEAKTTDGKDLFQYKAMEEDEETYRQMLKKHGKMSESEINKLFSTVDKALVIIKNNLEVLDYAWDVDIDDRSFSPVKPNSDNLYKVSLDFSTLCRKRILQQVIQTQLQDALNKPLSREESIAIRDELMKIQEEGRQIEIACALCYVESARMKSPAQIKKFLKDRENVIKEFLASKSGGDIKQKIAKAEADARERLGVGNATLKSMPDKIADQIRAAKKEAKKAYTPTAEEQKLIDAAKSMSVTDFTSPEGLANLAKNYPVLFDAYTSFVRNATKSKGIEKDTWWRAGDSASIGDTLIANMNRENGLRSQSWSDFQVIHLLDYIAATIELSTRNAKEQAYSKVPDYIELMGNTGVMLNMSLIPTAKFNGKLEYDSVEGMAYKKALELREKYHATAGTICIGISDEQIKMLLDDSSIDYVIPYHKSGMAAHIRKLMHIPTWSEYEKYQNETNLSRGEAMKQAKKYGAKLLSESDENYQKHTAFSEWFDIEEARQIAKQENAFPTDAKLQKKLGVMYGGYMAMQNAANNYLKLCAERGIAPKFSHENANFSEEANYWKLIIDRKMVDNVTGEIIEQQAIKPIFDEAEVLRILNDELERYPSVKADQDYATRTVVEKFLSGEMNNRLDADTVATIMQKPVDNIATTNIIASEEGVKHQYIDAETEQAYMDAANSGDKATAKKMVDEAAKEAGFTLDEDGMPDLLFHGTDSFGFTTIDTSKSDDNLSFWATPNMGVAGSYYEGSNYRVREIGKEKVAPKGEKIQYYNSLEKAVSTAKQFSSELNLDLSKAKYVKESTVMKKAKKSIQKAVRACEVVMEGNYDNSIKNIAQRIITASKQGTYDAMSKAVNQFRWQKDLEITGVDLSETDLDEKFNIDKSDISKFTQGDVDVFKMMYRIGDVREDIFRDEFGTIKGKPFDLVDIALPYNDYVAEKGIYGFYHKENNPFVYDCDGVAWNKIEVPNEAKGHFTESVITTRQLAEWAFANGYDAIKLDNVIDVGEHAIKEAHSPATVWAFKNPESQIKSADPITYDDDGNVIPLSERFSEKDDIRYQYADVDSEGNKLSEGQQEFFKDSKVRDKKGNLLVLYHGTNSHFTVFNPNYSDDKRSFFLTDSPNVAHSYARSEKTLNPYEYLDEEATPERVAEVAENNVREWKSVKVVDHKTAEDATQTVVNSITEVKTLIDTIVELTEGSQLGRSFFMQGLKSSLKLFDTWTQTGKVFASQNPFGATTSKAAEILNLFDQGIIELSDEVVTVINSLIDMTTPMKPLFEVAKAYSDGGAVFEITDNRGNTFYEGEIMVRKNINWEQSGGLMPLYANIKNPLIVEAGGRRWNNIKRLPEMDASYPDILNTRMVSEFASKNGYDGVIFKGLVDIGGYSSVKSQRSTIVIAFDSNQLKSTQNTNPTSDPDIRYQYADESLSDRYSYEELTSKPDMKLTLVGGTIPNNRADVVAEAKKNAAKVGKFNPKNGSVSVHVDDIGVDVFLGTDGLKHGLRRKKGLQNNATAIVTLKAGEILKNSIRVNKLIPSKENASSSYVLIGAAKSSSGELYVVRFVVNQFSNELTSMDVLYAINAKKELAVLNAPRSTAKPLSVTNSNISIAQLLDFVNNHFPDVLPESVLRHYGYDARPDGELGEDALYQYADIDAIDNRTLLAKSLEGATKNDIEKTKLKEYQKKIELINAEEKKLRELRAQIKEISFSKGARDTDKLKKLQFEANQAANRINVYDKQLLRLEATKPLMDVVQREKDLVRKKMDQERKAAVKAAKEKDMATIREIMNRHTESRKKAIERRDMAQLRNKIRSFKENLEGTLLNPTDRRYVPFGLAQAVVDVCNLIDTDTDLYKKDGSINKSQEKRNLTKEKLQTLKDEYEKLKDYVDPIYSGEFDEAIYYMLKDLKENFEGRNLKELNLDELQEMYYILRSIGDTLADARNLIGKGEAYDVYDAGYAIIDEQREVVQKRKKDKRSGAQKATDGIINLSLAPVRNVERMSGYKEDSVLVDLFNDFEVGVRQKNFFEMESKKGFESIITGKNAKAYESAIYDAFGNKEYVDDKGKKFSISKMQMMQAILSQDRERANKMNHIKGGGLAFADLNLLRKGNLKEAISTENSHLVSNADGVVEQFRQELADDKWAQEYMAAAKAFFDGKAKDAINNTMLTLKHRIVAKDKNYIPFEVDKSFVVREISAANDIQQTINSYGMLQETKDKAPQPLIMTGLNNIIDRHIDQVSTVVGLAIPVRNFNKVWNVHSVDGVNTTVNGTVETNWGVEGRKFIEQVVQDIQGPRHNTQSELYKKVKSGYIGATFLLNGSVVTKQIGSLFAATSMLKWRDPASMMGNLLYTMVNYKKIAAEVDKYTASAWTRRQGMSDAEVYTLITEGKKNRITKAINKLPAPLNPAKWITAMDSAVALSLWKYAKQDIQKAHPELSGEELNKAAANLYDSVIENTQSMTDVLHRPEIQKRSDILSEAFGMFKTDLYQMSGQLQNAVGRFGTNKSKENAKYLGRTVYSIAASAIWGSLMTTAFALLRYKVKPYRDDEDDELTVESWLKRLSFGFGGDLVGYILPLFGSEVVGTIENIVYGESEDIADSLALTAINDLYSTTVNIASSLKEGEAPSVDDYKKLLTKSLQVFGIPANNILRTIDAIRLHAEDIANGEFFSFEAGREKSNGQRLYEAILRGNEDQIEKLELEFADDDAVTAAIRKALRENDERITEAAQARLDGDLEEYESIAREIVSEGHFDQDDVVAAINTAMNKLKGDNDASESKKDDDKLTSYYSASDINASLEKGDTTTALKVIDDIVQVKTENYISDGYKKSEAKKKAEASVKSSVTSYWKPLYLEAKANKDLNEVLRIKKILKATKLYDDVTKTTDEWWVAYKKTQQ